MLDSAREQPDPLRAGMEVRLVRALGGIPVGAVGRLLGFFRYPHGEACLVAFDGARTVQIERGSLEQA